MQDAQNSSRAFDQGNFEAVSCRANRRTQVNAQKVHADAPLKRSSASCPATVWPRKHTRTVAGRLAPYRLQTSTALIPSAAAYQNSNPHAALLSRDRWMDRVPASAIGVFSILSHPTVACAFTCDSFRHGLVGRPRSTPNARNRCRVSWRNHV